MESRPVAFARKIRSNRSGSDFYTTPYEAVTPLLDNLHLCGRVLDPCCGTGNISRMLLRRGLSVEFNDIEEYDCGLSPHTTMDFIGGGFRGYDAVVANPPYTLAQEFIEESLAATADRRGKVAMLLRLSFLEGQRRRKMFDTTPLSKVLVFSRRISCLLEGRPQENSGSIAFAWLVWDHRHKGNPELSWI